MMKNQIKLLVLVATALSAQSVQCMEKESASAESELALSKLPARVTVQTYRLQGRELDQEFLLDAAVACQSGLIRRACGKEFTFYGKSGGVLSCHGDFAFSHTDAARWQMIAPFLHLLARNKMDEMRSALAAMDAVQLAAVVDVAKELEVPAVVESARARLQDN